jgi:hypothetical protein
MIGFIDASLQLQPIITAHSQWLSKTRSLPYWTTSVFSSPVSDLVLIYESVTSSASVVRWLTLHSWTLSYWALLRRNHWNPLRMIPLSFITRGERTRDHHLEQFVCFIRCYETCVSLLATLWYLQACSLQRFDFHKHIRCYATCVSLLVTLWYPQACSLQRFDLHKHIRCYATCVSLLATLWYLQACSLQRFDLHKLIRRYETHF